MPNFTRTAIKMAFIKILNEKPLSKITVKDIVEECGINRNSFYYHFQDIAALIEEIVTEEADRIISKYPTIDSLETGLNAAIDFAEENRRAILHIYNSVNRDIFEQYLWKVCEYVVVTYGNTVFSDKAINDFDKDLIIRVCKCECFGMVIEWMNTGMKDDVHERISRFCELHKGMIEEIIERSMKSPAKQMQ
jgi:AcrR family transcriptional regulator